jgi:glycerol-3-phosphate acyltransferase PlsY
VFFRFAGGKGVATALGVLVAVSGVLGLAIAVTWALVAYFFRYSSLASLVAAVLAPLYYLVGDGAAWYMDKWILLSTTAMSALLIWRHAENMARLLKGKESRLGAKKP